MEFQAGNHFRRILKTLLWMDQIFRPEGSSPWMVVFKSNRWGRQNSFNNCDRFGKNNSKDAIVSKMRIWKSDFERPWVHRHLNHKLISNQMSIFAVSYWCQKAIQHSRLDLMRFPLWRPISLLYDSYSLWRHQMKLGNRLWWDYVKDKTYVVSF